MKLYQNPFAMDFEAQHPVFPAVRRALETTDLVSLASEDCVKLLEVAKGIPVGGMAMMIAERTGKALGCDLVVCVERLALAEAVGGSGTSATAQGWAVTVRRQDVKALLLEQFRELHAVKRTLAEAEQRIAGLRGDLERVRQAKENFLLMIRHELKTPINAIRGAIDVLLEKARSPEDRDLLSMLQDETSQLHRVVKNLLSATQRNRPAPAAPAEVVCTKLSSIYQKVLAEFSLVAAAKGLGLGLRGPPSAWPEVSVLADPETLTSILRELVSNAIKFTDKGEVWLEARDWTLYRHRFKGDILVGDTGPGIPEGLEEVIFEDFYQIEGGTRRHHEGLGLGLSTARHLAKSLQGSLQCEPAAGSGSVFSWHLDLVRCD